MSENPIRSLFKTVDSFNLGWLRLSTNKTVPIASPYTHWENKLGVGVTEFSYPCELK